MVEMSSFYARLANREGFNSSVRHINRTLDLLETCNPKNNIADEINRMLSEKSFETEQIQAAVNMLLVEKWKYKAVSRNLAAIVSDASSLVSEIAKIKAIDLVLGYHHPDLGFIVLNPKNPENASVMAGFRKNELIVVYAGCEKQSDDTGKKAVSAINILIDLLEDKNAKAPAALTVGPYSFIAPKKVKVIKAPKVVRVAKPTAAQSQATGWKIPVAQQAAPAAVAVPLPTAAPPSVPSSSKMSGLVSVVVSNELFHNGNVEAWKRIIRSFNARYPNLQVFIYYDGERIVDINTLFKWGKVKHGSCIQFCVAGENVQDLAKLSRYFRQGASPQFEAFLHGSPDTVMNLF